MFANNEIGTIEPVEKLCEIAHKHGVLFHTDAVQAAGKIDIDLSKMPFDFLSISGHKVYAPKGVGVLFARKSVKNIIYYENIDEVRDDILVFIEKQTR